MRTAGCGLVFVPVRGSECISCLSVFTYTGVYICGPLPQARSTRSPLPSFILRHTLLTWWVWLCPLSNVHLSWDNPTSYGLHSSFADSTSDATLLCVYTVSYAATLGWSGASTCPSPVQARESSPLSPSVIPRAPWTLCHSSETPHHLTSLTLQKTQQNSSITSSLF